MTKLIKLNQETENTLGSILKLAESGKVKGCLVAGFEINGEVVTGWADLDCNQMATLIGHLQVDLMNRFIKANYVVEEN